jgi:hypothetical protein
MSDLKDSEIERLSNLFASGNMNHAREIAHLLGQELAQQPRKGIPLFAVLGNFLSASVLIGRNSPKA